MNNRLAGLILSLVVVCSLQPFSTQDTFGKEPGKLSKSSAKVFRIADGWLWTVKKPVRVGDYKYIPGLTPTYHVRSYVIKKNGKQVAGERVDQTGWDRQFGIVLPLVTTKPISKTDFVRGGRLVRTPPEKWAEKVFGVSMWEKSEKPQGSISPGTDITGDGIPDLVIGYQPEGHNGYRADVFSLGSSFKKLFRIEGEDNPVYFKDVDGDGLFEILAADSTFAYWHASYADSHLPRIILRIKGNKLVVANDLLKAPTPSAKDLETLVENTKKELESSEDQQQTFVPLVTGHMLDLVYTGNAKSAWSYLDLVWTGDGKRQIDVKPMEHNATKNEFLSEFKAQLAKSPYWRGLQELNRGQL